MLLQRRGKSLAACVW